MAHEVLHSDELSEPVGVFVQATRVEASGHVIYVSGLTSRNRDGSVHAPGDARAQTQRILENLQKILQRANATLDDVCKVTVFLKNMADRETVNIARREYFGPQRPTSTLVEISRLVRDDLLVEIDAIAALPE